MRTPSVYEYRVMVAGVAADVGAPLLSEEDAFQVAALVEAGLGPSVGYPPGVHVQPIGPAVTIELRRLAEDGTPAEGWGPYRPVGS